MNHAFFINFLIILLIAIGLIVTANPLFVLGLFFLQEMPYGLLQTPSISMLEEGECDPDDPNRDPKTGFTAQI